MNAPQSRIGIGLICNADGRVVKVLHQISGVGDWTGRLLGDVVDAGSAEKARRFVEILRTSGAVFDWELVVPSGAQMNLMHFAGGASGGDFLVVGVGSRADMAVFYEKMAAINNAQANEIRALAKERIRLSRDAALYEDMTRLNNELAAAQREMVQKNAELERLNQQKNLFLGMASHDLRNPLGAISEYSESLLEELALTPEQRSYLEVIRSSSKFMLGLVNELLDVSRIEAGKFELALETVDLAELIARTVAYNRLLARRKHIEIDFEMPEDFPPLRLDASKIEQVMNNLLSNAVKYSHPRTTIYVRLTCEGSEVVVAVRDEGQGIPADERDRLFEPFQKTSVKATGGELSIGLGLAIARRVATGHGGRIWVDSEVGKGSTFSFSLPVVTGEDDRVPKEKTRTSEEIFAGIGPLRVLVADDNVVNQRLLQRLLEKAGHSVRAVGDGQAVLAALDDGNWDVVVLDIQMPVMDGCEAAMAIREKEKYGSRRLPIIALTGHTDIGERQRCQDAGMDAYLRKPVDRNALFEAIARMVHRR